MKLKLQTVMNGPSHPHAFRAVSRSENVASPRSYVSALSISGVNTYDYGSISERMKQVTSCCQ